MSASVYTQLSELITVGDLASPLGPDLGVGLTSGAANDVLIEAGGDGGYDAMRRISLVKDKAVTVGWTSLDMLGPSDAPFEIEPVSPDSMLAADTTAFQAIRLFGTTNVHFFLVLQHNRVMGSLHFTDLSKLPFRSACLL